MWAAPLISHALLPRESATERCLRSRVAVRDRQDVPPRTLSGVGSSIDHKPGGVMAKTAPLLKDSRWWAISERALREALAAVASGASWRSVMADLIAESRLDEGD